MVSMVFGARRLITSIRVLRKIEVQECMCACVSVCPPVFAQETDSTGGLVLDVKAQSRSKLYIRADESS